MRSEVLELSETITVPALTDGVVTLRKHAHHDVDRIVGYATDPLTMRWARMPSPYGRSDAERFIVGALRGWDTGLGMTWAIEFEGRFVGSLALEGAGRVVDVGFVLHPDARGQGVARRAMQLAMRYASTERDVEVVRWEAAEGNLTSLRAAHAAGFTLLSRMPDWLEMNSKVVDAWTAIWRAGDGFEPTSTWRSTSFETDRFRMRPLVEDDDERIRETLDDPASRTYLFGRPDPLTVEHAGAERTRKWWTAACGQTCTWAVADKEDDRYLADISLFKIDPTTGAEAGFYTHPEARGRGVLGETFPAAVQHAFTELDMRRLTLFAAESNKGSIALARSAGMHEFGVQPLAADSGGEIEDLVCFELLRDR
ncbi:GNAT family N-acetyltransferase [Gordonia desulfuricans]|uniref:GNAT family N-acetyltransferase n=1 Tax=Gordonia desulfuricans TaxID=89051 RepID=A0A7K3LTD0_9ACTN|nr:GNAT family N-acetyltransferase [Gordonia desulfuricans]NDK91261.1 GNAT family N-acetyltransferase [Gordonia desulfuricans]